MFLQYITIQTCYYGHNNMLITNKYISICSLSICIYNIFYIYFHPTNGEQTPHRLKRRAWKMSQIWCYTNPVNVGQPTKRETNNENWELPCLVPPKRAIQRQRFTKHQHASFCEQTGKMYNILRPWNRDVVSYNKVAKNTRNKWPYTRSIWWGGRTHK